MVGPYSGTFSALGQAMWEGSKAAEAAVNASGGIMGRKLVMDLVDTIGDPADAVPAVDKEIISNHPAGVIGPQGNEIGATQPIFDKNQIPFMFQGGSTIYDNNTDPYLWRSNPSDSQLGVAMAAWALKQGYKNCAFTFSTANSVQTLGKVVEDAFTKNGGKIAADVPLDPAAAVLPLGDPQGRQRPSRLRLPPNRGGFGCGVLQRLPSAQLPVRAVHRQ